MCYYANPGKSLTIKAEGQTYIRHAIRTHFITTGEDYLALIRRYVFPCYRPGDLLSISEKIIALCQGRVVWKEMLHPGLLAHLLTAFVQRTPAGPGAGNIYKMQFAIDFCGSRRVIWAALRAGFDKLRGVRGTFYRLTGQEIAGLDGFYGAEFAEYAHMGIRIPANPNGVCDEIEASTGIPSMIVDANNINVEILGKAASVRQTDAQLRSLIWDNPAGQDRYLTPFILIRPADSN